jgi:hypothetical protein
MLDYTGDSSKMIMMNTRRSLGWSPLAGGHAEEDGRLVVVLNLDACTKIGELGGKFT